MQTYAHLTDALRAALLMAVRGYDRGVTFAVDGAKVDAITAKWAEAYGIGLPAWKRYQRKRAGLPNAWACSMPEPGLPGKRRLLLLSTGWDEARLDKRSPWLRERWVPLAQLAIGDYVIKEDRRDRGDRALTVRLAPRCYGGLDAYWRSLSGQGAWDQLAHDAARAVRFYPMFGGVRRQLRRLIRGYAKLYKARTGRAWPGPDPERLPVMGAFRCVSQQKAVAADCA